MSAPVGARARAALATAAARVEGFFLEPVESPPPQERRPTALAPVPPAPPELRPVVAVFGLARRCGATVVARALAAELGARDRAGAAAVCSRAGGGTLPLATGAAVRLARMLAEVPGAATGAAGRLCLVQGADPGAVAATACHFAPLVIDAGVELGGAVVELADTVVLVAGPAVQPALARVAAETVRGAGSRPLVAGTRGAAGDLTVPESRMGAQLALAGRQARGELGRAVGAVADACEALR